MTNIIKIIFQNFNCKFLFASPLIRFKVFPMCSFLAQLTIKVYNI